MRINSGATGLITRSLVCTQNVCCFPTQPITTGSVEAKNASYADDQYQGQGAQQRTGMRPGDEKGEIKHQTITEELDHQFLPSRTEDSYLKKQNGLREEI